MATRQEIRDYFAKFGKEGGKARAKNMTPEERSDAARKAVQSRWAKNEKRIEKALKEVNEGTKALEGKMRARRATQKKS